jgi:uncharacterized protein with ACT and thioredoxin-like domain
MVFQNAEGVLGVYSISVEMEMAKTADTDTHGFIHERNRVIAYTHLFFDANGEYLSIYLVELGEFD